MQPARMARILIADDHQEFLQEFAAGLADRYQVVGTAVNGEELLHLAGSTKPDLIITDISMPGMSGIRALEKILAQPNPPKAILVTMESSTNYVRYALQLGATGYVAKVHAREQIDEAIRTVFDGKTYLSPELDFKLAETR